MAATQYSVYGGAVQTYTSPFQVTGDGAHTVQYYSTDKAGNVESTQSIDFKIDATDPTIAIDVPADGSHVGLGKTVSAADSVAYSSTASRRRSRTARPGS